MKHLLTLAIYLEVMTPNTKALKKISIAIFECNVLHRISDIVVDFVLQFESKIAQQRSEIEELSEKLLQEQQAHQHSVTVLRNEQKLKVDEVICHYHLVDKK